MEQAFEMVENLTEELSEKEDRIIQLEKELKEYKLLFSDCDDLLHGIIEDQITKGWRCWHRSDYKRYPDNIFELTIGCGMSDEVSMKVLPTSLETYNNHNVLDLDEEWTIKYYPEHDTNCLYVHRKDKVFDKKDVLS